MVEPDAARPVVLVVDDEAEVRELVSEILGRAGFRPVTADDGERVLELALQHHPALIILDIMLPKVDGYTTVVRLRGDPLTRHIPVIMITGRTERWFPMLSADMGTVAHLLKPFSPDQLLEAVRAALGQGGA